MFLGLLHEDRGTDGRKWGSFWAHICIFTMRIRQPGSRFFTLNGNCKPPVVFTVHMRYTARSHTKRRSDPVCLDNRLIISLSVSKGQHSNPLHSADATELHIQQPFACKKKFYRLQCILLYMQLILQRIYYLFQISALNVLWGYFTGKKHTARP